MYTAVGKVEYNHLVLQKRIPGLEDYFAHQMFKPIFTMIGVTTDEYNNTNIGQDFSDEEVIKLLENQNARTTTT